ncbi:MAG: glycosyltransferase family 4 protein, partial [Gammaproteobacteria bacterium]|nr:glycosyltransferase family 4 protein [Gammaproteobacteria bacterium]
LPLEARGVLGYAVEYAAALAQQFRLALKVWRKHGFDVIHGCNPPDTIWLVALFFKLFGKAYVFDHHDICPELYEAKFGSRDVFHALMFALERLSFAAASVGIATNDSYRRIALERGRMRPEDVFVVRSGPDLKRLEQRPPRPELKRGKAHLIGYVGVIGRQEGLDLFLQSMAHLTGQLRRRDLHAVVVGGGPELEAIKREAYARGLETVVTFTGRAPDDLLLDVLNTADVCVKPDRVNAMNDKSTMNKIMEYMALAKPIVQFDLTEGRVSAGEASLYAAPNDPIDFAEKIAELLDAPGRRAAMGCAGYARVRDRLSWEASAPHLLAAYDRVFEKIPRPRPARRAGA